MLDRFIPTPHCPCSSCGVTLKFASSLTAHTPKPGDVSICTECAGVNIFTEELNVRAPTQADWDKIRSGNNYPRFQQTVAAVIQLNRQRRRDKRKRPRE